MIKILFFFKKGTNDSLSFLAKKKENTNMLGIIINNSYKNIYLKNVYLFFSIQNIHTKFTIQQFKVLSYLMN